MDQQSRKPDQQVRQWLPGLEKPATRQQAVQALAELGVPAVGPLARVMREGEHNTSQAAARALMQIGAPAVEALCELLSDEDWNVSQSAALALVRIGAPAVEPLCRTLANPNRQVAHLAVMALTKIRKPACDALCRALGNPQPELRAQARRALIKMGAPAIPTVTRAFHQPEKYAAPAGRGAAVPGSESSGERVRVEAADVLCGIGGSALDVLCSSLGSADEARRWIATATLEQNKSRAVEPLCRYLAAHGAQVKPTSDAAEPAAVQAAILLGRLGKLRAQEALMDALDSPDARVRAAAARAIGELAQETRSPELRAHLSSLRRRLRGKAREAEEWLALDSAIQAIETATDTIANIPMPSANLAPEKDTLPRAAGPAAPTAQALPIAADTGDQSEPTDHRDWWSRFTGRFR